MRGNQLLTILANSPLFKDEHPRKRVSPFDGPVVPGVFGTASILSASQVRSIASLTFSASTSALSAFQVTGDLTSTVTVGEANILSRFGLTAQGSLKVVSTASILSDFDVTALPTLSFQATASILSRFGLTGNLTTTGVFDVVPFVLYIDQERANTLYIDQQLAKILYIDQQLDRTLER